ncbi:MmcQ/YjbR family DNA-binding protein [Agrococcus versicolor]|uniref:MmcQ/YjbR family DNA-binding protein n=1 Tax=Agrococcus versicolor TaxID=501482 RepID=A0ABP5MMC8_9MICO
MSHPPIVDPRAPHVERVRRLALELPGADEKISHGAPAFFTTKVFAYVAAHERVDDELVLRERALSVLLEEDERRALLAEGAFTPAYTGPSGWVAIDLDAIDDARLAELLDASFRVTAPARRVRELDAR